MLIKYSRRQGDVAPEGVAPQSGYAIPYPRLLGILRGYWKRVQPGLWLFPGRDPRVMSETRWKTTIPFAGRRAFKSPLAEINLPMFLTPPPP